MEETTNEDVIYFESYYSEDNIFIDPYTEKEYRIRNPYQISLEIETKELKSRVKRILSTEMDFKVIKGSNGKRNLRGYELYCYRLCVPEFIIFCLKFYKIKETNKSIILYERINGSKQYGIEVFYILKNHLLFENIILPIEINYTNIKFNENTVLGFILSIFDDFEDKPRTTLLIIYYLERLKEDNIDLFRGIYENRIIQEYIEILIERYNKEAPSDNDIMVVLSYNIKKLVYDRLQGLFNL